MFKFEFKKNSTSMFTINMAVIGKQR